MLQQEYGPACLQAKTGPTNELSIKAASVWLPQGDLAPAQMAVLAAKNALERSGTSLASIGYLVHVFVYHQGYDLWSPAHYIANQAGIDNALPVNVQQPCNGGPLALHLASTWLAATPEASAALITTADRFCLPGISRHAGDCEAIYGDSAAALLLGRRGGDGDLLHLLALEMAAEDEWEIQGFERLHEIFWRSLSKANIEPSDIRCVALPRLTRQMRENVFMPAVGLLLGRHPVCFECDTGGLGTADFLATMASMAGNLGPGDIGLLIQGGGFTLSCAVVQAPVSN